MKNRSNLASISIPSSCLVVIACAPICLEETRFIASHRGAIHYVPAAFKSIFTTHQIASSVLYFVPMIQKCSAVVVKEENKYATYYLDHRLNTTCKVTKPLIVFPTALFDRCTFSSQIIITALVVKQMSLEEFGIHPPQEGLGLVDCCPLSKLHSPARRCV